ncbi:MAG: acetyl-CoA carboxylase carboxyl transferase subunit alpha [Micavibrio sp.]|nr:acetyl-CoA carboxylase carboxyl transferase subunit alpha [Micavibrio sp.]HCK33024.1 acetyl-CoA carboxylase carboxyl transferase subunit alpha [Rhodospirillaceae bacterium]
MSQLDFEKPIIELEGKIAELRHMTNADAGLNIAEEIARMESKIQRLMVQTYSKLNAAQIVQVARHQERPHTSDYIRELITDFTPLAGDRNYGEDHAIIGGLGRFKGNPCVIMGHEKGSDTKSRIKHNFGMARPEGYRKAQRLMNMAEQFNLPVVTMIDTAGAYPGVGAEERGQSEAIAKSIETCLRAETPIVSVVIGEGGSGGAIAIAAANRVLMLEHSIYSVISPEGCASILWRSAEHSKEAATALKLTAKDLKALKLIDEIISEPLGGAHRNHKDTINAVGDTIEKHLKALSKKSGEDLVKDRREKFLAMGTNI